MPAELDSDAVYTHCIIFWEHISRKCATSFFITRRYPFYPATRLARLSSQTHIHTHISLPLIFMIFAVFFVTGLALAPLAVGAPSGTAKRGSVISSSSVEVDPTTFFGNYFVADEDKTCTSNQLAKVQKDVEDAVTIALVAQKMKATDVAFNKYFVKVKQQNDLPIVQNMFRSMLTPINKIKPNQKITVTCFAEENPICGTTYDYLFTVFIRTKLTVVPFHRYAATEGDFTKPPRIAFCPHFFESSSTTARSLSDKPFDATGWCTPSRYNLRRLETGGHTILHELTHVPFISDNAGILAIVVKEKKIRPGNVVPMVKSVRFVVPLRPAMKGVIDGVNRTGVKDIRGWNDENDNNPVTTKNVYSGGPKERSSLASLALQQRWIAFLNQGESGKLKQPPLKTTANAESYAAAATGELLNNVKTETLMDQTEYFFYKKCALKDANQISTT
ncbi:hypothetical protein DFH06DRAFT_1314177 [Mycena polygramma]|nr:hypothetical protein DFH06DRAFT_1314177 [Mycena polygramma]